MTKRATQHKSNTPVEWEQAEGFSRYLISTDGQVYSIDNDKILKPNRNSSGYVRVPLYNDENEYKQTLVHRLVYMAHVGPIPKGMQIKRTRTKQITVLRILKLSHQNRIFIMEVLPLDGAKALKGTGKKREKWPLVDVVSEFILFETMQMKPQISIRKYA
jgi:hypothetical protein